MVSIERIIQDSIDVKSLILKDANLIGKIQCAADACVASLKAGGKVHLCGNGGSAADAQHIAAELSGRFYYDRPPLNAEALHVNTSYLTAVANDYSYNLVYSRMIQAAAKKDDILIGISTSGNSENILNAFATAREIGVTTIALTGESGGKMGQSCDILINVPSRCTPRIQESHIMIGHIICEIIETTLFPQ